MMFPYALLFHLLFYLKLFFISITFLNILFSYSLHFYTFLRLIFIFIIIFLFFFFLHIISNKFTIFLSINIITRFHITLYNYSIIIIIISFAFYNNICCSCFLLPSLFYNYLITR